MANKYHLLNAHMKAVLTPSLRPLYDSEKRDTSAYMRPAEDRPSDSEAMWFSTKKPTRKCIMENTRRAWAVRRRLVSWSREDKIPCWHRAECKKIAAHLKGLGFGKVTLAEAHAIWVLWSDFMGGHWLVVEYDEHIIQAMAFYLWERERCRRYFKTERIGTGLEARR